MRAANERVVISGQGSGLSSGLSSDLSSELMTNPELSILGAEYTSCIKAGHLEVRFANCLGELRAAQSLRYESLYVENGGSVSSEMRKTGREMDQWDTIARHIIVVDTRCNTTSSELEVVGTLRLVSNIDLPAGQDFYTEDAYNIACLRGYYERILELSRFCIDSKKRSGSILMLIWKFAMQYIFEKDYQLMIGCASFPGTDVMAHQSILSYLYRHNLAPKGKRCIAKPDNAVMISDMLSDEPVWDEAKKSVPTLLRGYLKIGARITDTVIIDPVFNTVFVAIYVDAADMISENHTLVPKADSNQAGI